MCAGLRIIGMAMLPIVDAPVKKNAESIKSPPSRFIRNSVDPPPKKKQVQVPFTPPLESFVPTNDEVIKPICDDDDDNDDVNESSKDDQEHDGNYIDNWDFNNTND
ncbi:hypothetical protein VNO80_02946 [Phaseolus coccineus]|uniref:Uncharacterized protein n=1 Tax=Phaseolus coccineus TaxID=3886 RepID=A0AAN9NQK5_PHACN